MRGRPTTLVREGTTMATIGERVSKLRREQQLTQEQLADRAGLSVGAIRKIERERHNARLDTLRRIAKVLGVATTSLIGDAPDAVAHATPGHRALPLLALRQALTPVVGYDGRVLSAVADQPTLTIGSVRAHLVEANTAYHANDFGVVVGQLPVLIAEARTLVSNSSGDDQSDAQRIASGAYQLAARLLLQIRAHDLAHTAAIAAREAAAESGHMPTIAAAVSPMCWLLMRQARLSESAELAAVTADGVEPPRISQATSVELASWGWLWVRAAAAAARDGRDQDAHGMLDLAATAATRMTQVSQPSGQTQYALGWLAPSKVQMMRAEVAAITGDPAQVLRYAGTVGDTAGVLASCKQRHQLDVAWAHAARRQWPEATEVLTRLSCTAPGWMRHQRYAKDVIRTVRDERRRAATQDLANLITLVGLDG
ncbi:helix-turn-helix domain-containing protein [Micromonospora sp. LOL_023]|uniref:helix-turn-helix domain-containing protein n=1 Tax=Micromonospora sp. LOL_023 TaxID=3345418 RepID=UPI003A8B70A2